MKISLQQRMTQALVAGAFCLVASFAPADAADLPVVSRGSLDQGFHLLYNLDFDQAHQVFVSWQHEHPQDPVGPTAEAAGLLFSEFHRLGVLEGQFYEDDRTFTARRKLNPDPVLRDLFNRALARAQASAGARLASSPQDRDALFAMTLTSGLQADYAALIEKRNMSSLHYTRDAVDWAAKVLAVDPRW